MRQETRWLLGGILLMVISAGCGREYPVEELGKIHTEIPYVEGVEVPIKISKPASARPPQR